MIDSIFTALSGLRGYSTGLKVIANNTANLNTPGFKGSSVLFADMYNAGGGLGGPGTGGLGLSTLGTVFSFQQGQFQTTNDPLNLAVDGLGLFVLRDPNSGQIRYTRDGQFKFNNDGVLVTSGSEELVLGLDGPNGLGPITIANVRTDLAAATTAVTFGGNLTTGLSTATVNNVTIYDVAGTAHTLTLQFDAVAGTPGAWNVTVRDGTTTIATEQRIQFNNGVPVAGQATVNFNYTVEGQAALPIRLDFSQNVTSYGSGTTTSLAMATQDGHGPGQLQGTAFDEDGTMVLSYSNGRKVRTTRLALARFDSADAVRAAGDNRFEAVDMRAWIMGYAKSNGFGSIKSSNLEMSNVDLSAQFSDLVIMQRGYQAASQVVSTANEMLADLFSMKGK